MKNPPFRVDFLRLPQNSHYLANRAEKCYNIIDKGMPKQKGVVNNEL